VGRVGGGSDGEEKGGVMVRRRGERGGGRGKGEVEGGVG
jgi:hypothetical protein